MMRMLERFADRPSDPPFLTHGISCDCFKTGTRPLGIPTVADRLLQRAVARIIEAVFEADFLDCVTGFKKTESDKATSKYLEVEKKIKDTRACPQLADSRAVPGVIHGRST
jgi:hypothetical protein